MELSTICLPWTHCPTDNDPNTLVQGGLGLRLGQPRLTLDMATIQPTMRQEIRISSETVLWLQYTASQPTWSSKERVERVERAP